MLLLLGAASTYVNFTHCFIKSFPVFINDFVSFKFFKGVCQCFLLELWFCFVSAYVCIIYFEVVLFVTYRPKIGKAVGSTLLSSRTSVFISKQHNQVVHLISADRVCTLQHNHPSFLLQKYFSYKWYIKGIHLSIQSEKLKSFTLVYLVHLHER